MFKKMENWSSTKKSRYLAYLMIDLYCAVCFARIWNGKEPDAVLTGAWTTVWGGSVATGTLISKSRVKKMVEMPPIEEEGE